MNLEKVAQTYQTNLLQYTATQQRLLQKKNTIAWLRLLIVVATAFLAYSILSIHLAGFVLVIIAGIILFLWIVKTDVANQQLLQHTEILINLNKEELAFLQNEIPNYLNDGSAYQPKEPHPYADDIDILGKGSLFQYINRCETEQGAALLASQLLHAPNHVDIVDKQKAVAALESEIHWMQEGRALARKNKISTHTQEKIHSWLFTSNQPFQQQYWQWLLPFYVGIQLLVLFAYVFDFLPTVVVTIWYTLSFIIATTLSKQVLQHHQLLNKIVSEISVLEKLLLHVEKKSFPAIFLQQLQQQLKQQNTSASTEIQYLKGILQRFDVRLNVYVFIILNTIFLWDVWQIRALNKWRIKNAHQVQNWFAVIAQFEVVQSFAIAGFNHPSWHFPTIKTSFFSLQSQQMGHPLIPYSKAVTNDFSTTGTGQITLITGSNMAGKSTFLRSIGCNIVLALAGSKVCAASFSISPIRLMTSMRIADNLAENTSTFYAELKKLKAIIEAVQQQQPVFILLDEILRGTNSLDRHTGSKALIQQFIQQKTQAIVATHDVELSKLVENYPQNIANYHFDVQVKNEELFFDYKLKNGVCTSLNATILMRQIGIEM